MIRIAAVGDVHVGTDARAFAEINPEQLAARADLLLIAGDLTQHGRPEEGKLLAVELERLDLPIVVVLGNHDYQQGEQTAIRLQLERVGVFVLEEESVELDVEGHRFGVAGVKGFGGGFTGACGSEFGEDEMKAFIRHSRLKAEGFGRALEALRCDMKIALTHYAPVRGTLLGESPEIYPFLGSYFLGEAIDVAGCVAAFHGHAHKGTEHAMTPAGIPVRNVARPVIKLAYKIYTLRTTGDVEEHPIEQRA